MTLKQIVNDYIHTQRPHTQAEMLDFANEQNSSAAIRRAAFCETKNGKRHSHQRRLPKWLLQNVETELQSIRRKLSNAFDFAELHKLVKAEISSIKGIGALTVYDIANALALISGKLQST